MWRQGLSFVHGLANSVMCRIDRSLAVAPPTGAARVSKQFAIRRRTSASVYLALTAVLAVLAFPSEVRSQEKPLSVTGTFSTGYYNTYSRGEENSSLSFIPVGAKFDINGYFMMPDFLSFSVQPQIGYGPQASDAGFDAGNGVRLRVTLLRKRSFPLTFHYSNLEVEDVYFGSLTQLSSYTLKNRNKDLGLTWEFLPKGAPQTIVDLGTNSVDSVPGLPNIPDYLSHGNHVNANTMWDKSGWALEGFVHHQYEVSNLLSSPADLNPSSLEQNVTQYQASARRNLFQDSEFLINGGSQSTSSILVAMPISLSTRYVSTNLLLRQRRRWKSSIRASYTSNIASQLLAQATSTLATPGAVAIGDSILTPFNHGAATYEFNGLTSADLAHGFGVYGSAERSAVLSSSLDGPLNTNYFTTEVGVTYKHRFSWANVTGQFGQDLGVGSITGESGFIQGQTYNVTAQHGTPDQMEYEGVLHGINQSVHNALPVTNHSVSIEGSIGHHMMGRFSGRIGGGYQRSSFVNAANEYRTNGYLARASLEHPRVQVSFSLNDSLSNSLPFYSQLFSGLGVGSILMAPLQIIPSDYHALSFTVHTNATRKLEISAFWTKSQQHLDGVLNNDFQLLNVYLTYHFRRIQVESGLIHSSQLFLNFPTTVRERFYIRFSRTARIL